MREISARLISEPYSLAAYTVLVFAILSLWLQRKVSIWGPLLGISASFAFLAHRLAPLGVLFSVLFLGAVYLYFQPRKKFGWIYGIVLSVLAMGLGSHLLPGFKNWKSLEAVVSVGAPPIPLYFNFDKALVGLALLGFGTLQLSKPSRLVEVGRKSLGLILLTSGVLLGLAVFAGSVVLDLKWPSFAPLWLLVNLLFVCVAEEAFFRGFLQRELCAVLERSSFWSRSFQLGGYKFGFRKIGFHLGRTLGWVLASACFGLAHYRGGIVYMGVSTVAGLFYGAALLKTHRIEASILTHFVVNSVHFLAFTYPFRG